MIRRAFVLTTLLMAGSAVSDDQPEVCSNWTLSRIYQAPDWYEKALAAPANGKLTQITDSLARTDYLLNDSTVLVHYQHKPFEAIIEHGRWNILAPGSIYLIGSDTVLLDSCPRGYSQLSVDESGSRCVARRIDQIGPDMGNASIVMYDLSDRVSTTVRVKLLGAGPTCSPTHPFYGYADYADLYIACWDDAGELIFRGGGGYAQESECADHWIRDMRWSPEGTTLVFKYCDAGVVNDQCELWEARLSTD